MKKVNCKIPFIWELYEMVYCASRRVMRSITRRATMLAGDRSQGEISPASIFSESRNYPNCVHWRICYFMWLQRIYEFFYVHSNPIYYTQNLSIESSVIENYAIDTRRSQYMSGSEKTIWRLDCNNVQHLYIVFIIVQWMLQWNRLEKLIE